MAEYTSRVFATTRYEWLIPLGSGAVEYDKAFCAAEQKFFKVKGRNVRYDDDLRLTANDEYVILFFVDEEHANHG